MNTANAPRPIYESAYTLNRERMVMDRVESIWNVKCAKLPRSYHVECGLLRGGNLVGWAEIKCRNCSSTDYDDYIISLQKILRALELSARTRVPFYLIIEWSDRLGFKTVTQIQEIRWGGRVDRSDPADMEPVAVFPVNQFVNLENLRL